ncbi:hypothetical protein D3C81_1551710 [compost metagenome]
MYNAIGRPTTMLAIWIANRPPAITRLAAMAPSSTHHNTRIQLGELMLPSELSMHRTWVPASAAVTKCTANSRQMITLRNAPSVGPSRRSSKVNIAVVVSLRVASRIGPPWNGPAAVCSATGSCW